MKEQFITYEIALKLRELGFNDWCFCFYNYSRKLLYYTGYDTLVYEELENITFNINKEDILAPLWQQAIDWIREKYDIHIIINKTYGYVILRGGKNPIGLNYIGNFYQAREQAILKVIELIEQNNEKNN